MSSSQILTIQLSGTHWLEVEYCWVDGKPRLYRSDLDCLIGNREGSFHIGGNYFSRSGRDINLVGNILHAQLRTSGGVWWDDQLVIEVEMPSCATSGISPVVKLRSGDYLRLKACRNLRIIGGHFLAAEYLDLDCSWRETCLDLDACLGFRKGVFDRHGRNFSGHTRNAKIAGGHLHAQSWDNVGGIQPGSIELKSFVQIKDGRLMPLREVEYHDVDIEILPDKSPTQVWLPSAQNIRLFSYKQKRVWLLVADCRTRLGELSESSIRLDHILGPKIDQVFCHPQKSSPRIPESAAKVLFENGMLTASFQTRKSEDWIQGSFDLKQIISTQEGALML